MNRAENTTTLETIANLKARGKRIVFTNGCFDLLHLGHLRYLSEAKNLGDVLVVGLNSDVSVKGLKGDSRPILPEAERKEMLLGLKPVDFVCVFSESTPLELIKHVNPDVLVKGGDYAIEQIVGHEYVQAQGGRVLSLSFVSGYSSSELIKKILEQSL